MKVKAVEKKLKFTKDPNDPGVYRYVMSLGQNGSGLLVFDSCHSQKRMWWKGTPVIWAALRGNPLLYMPSACSKNTCSERLIISISTNSLMLMSSDVAS